jgi:hypothetical protein
MTSLIIVFEIKLNTESDEQMNDKVDDRETSKIKNITSGLPILLYTKGAIV